MIDCPVYSLNLGHQGAQSYLDLQYQSVFGLLRIYLGLGRHEFELRLWIPHVVSIRSFYQFGNNYLAEPRA
jgi:hypothetical protein